MHCDICGKKKATVHLTEIVDDQISEMHLCEECAREKSAQMEQQFGLADLLAGLSDFGKQNKETHADESKVKIRCSTCGLSYEDFRKYGRLGCSECYDVFKTHLSQLLKKIHGANHHLGKTPVTVPREEKQKIENIQDIKNQLLKAIQLEQFEKAAELRDKIREIEKRNEG
jgi:protein arginine kinase activator